ncbi:hypothetical protein [Oxalicibacterium faecigallinarum]|uniref:hypothetical protein n=1 Tax=Oxalicibacterium faecigallinarum TaxID=573741 RepID=UPI00166B2D51|nr:hypothetical protein [Oxalicibacterium faecigallinarum]
MAFGIARYSSLRQQKLPFLCGLWQVFQKKSHVFLRKIALNPLLVRDLVVSLPVHFLAVLDTKLTKSPICDIVMRVLMGTCTPILATSRNEVLRSIEERVPLTMNLIAQMPANGFWRIFSKTE